MSNTERIIKTKLAQGRLHVIFIFKFFLAANGTLVPPIARTEAAPPCIEKRKLNHWIAWEAPWFFFFKVKSLHFLLEIPHSLELLLLERVKALASGSLPQGK